MPTCIFWANLTLFSLKLGRRRTAPAPGADMHGLAHGLLSTQSAAGPGADPLECAREAALGLGRIVALYHRSSALYHIH